MKQRPRPEITRQSVAAGVKKGLRILHLSDLHGTWFGEGQEEIVRLSAQSRPDIVAITGDFIDRTCDEQASVRLVERLAEIAPVYCVTGNHEEREMAAGAASYGRLIEAMGRIANARLLRGETVCLTDEITLTGADDYDFIGGREAYPAYLKRLSAEPHGRYRILLAHRPEMFDCYAEAGFDLTLSGHAHGGQIRLPLVGGLFAPGQGIFPRLTSGIYVHANGKRMFVSRGLGNSVPVPRLFNRPEMTVIEIGR